MKRRMDVVIAMNPDKYVIDGKLAIYWLADFSTTVPWICDILIPAAIEARKQAEALDPAVR